MPKSQSLGGSAANDMEYWKRYFTDQSQPGFYNDSDTQAAERSIGAGGQGFSGARQGLLRRSQIMEGFKAIAPFISQQAGFSHANASQTQAESARLVAIIKQGEIAKEQQQLAERGLLTRDTQAQAARRAEQISAQQHAVGILQQSQMGDQILKQMGITADSDNLSRSLASREYLQNDQQLYDADENAKQRSFLVQQGATAAANNFKLAGLNNTSATQRTRIAQGGNWDIPGEDDLVSKIIQSTSLTKTAPISTPATYNYDGSGGGSSVTYGSPQGPNEGTGEGTVSQPSYYFGTNSPNSNPLGIQNNTTKDYWSVDDPWDENGNWYN